MMSKPASAMRPTITTTAQKAVYRADDYVHEKPWQGIGVGAAVGLVLGLLLARR